MTAIEIFALRAQVTALQRCGSRYAPGSTVLPFGIVALDLHLLRGG